MGMRIVGTLALALLVPALAVAQITPAAGGSPRPATEVTTAMLEQAAKIGMAALKPGVSVSDRNIALSDTGAYNVTVAFVTRPATTVPSGRVLSHDKITEIYYVVRGSGTAMTGTMVDAKAERGSTTIGPGASSASPIANPRAIKLGPGEMQIIPPGVAHVWSEIADGGIDYITIRVDPERVTALSK